MYIEKYKLTPFYFSLIPGNDIFAVETELPGTTMSYMFKRFNFPRKVKLYSNVVAYSFAGVHRTVSSDGFEFDNEYPIAGVVYDGNGKFLIKIGSIFLSKTKIPSLTI